MESLGAEFTQTIRGGVVLNYDNDTSKNVVDLCYRTTTTLVNPIIDWTEGDVWNYLNSNGIEHCCLYDEGFRRIVCIGCPMSTKAVKELERWPKYREHYLKAFERMLKQRREDGLACEWQTAEEVMEWWTKR